MNRSPTNQKTPKKIPNIKSFTTGAALFVGILAIGIEPVQAEGSRNLYPASSPGTAYRANLEWRTETTGNLIKRRTLLKVYAKKDEYILVGSTAVGVDNGDIYIYNPGLVTGSIGSETVPSTPSFLCTSQTGRGKITSRTQELAGPQDINGTGNLGGYTPCYYQAPSEGIYDVVILGPRGFNGSGDGGGNSLPADIALTDANNFNSNQRTSVAAWDVTVRSSTSSTTDLNGRLFSYYLALFTADNGRPVYSTVYPVTTDGYRYRTEIRGLDPNGFVLYGNEAGFFDSDGISTLYRNVVGTNGNVSNIQGGASLARPQFPTFFNLLDPNALAFINRYDRFGTFQGVGINSTPVPPIVGSASFVGNLSGNNSKVGNGGTFSFNSTVTGSYEIVIKGSGSADFDPKNPINRVIRGYMNSSGTQTTTWDGRDNAGNFFPVGTNYQFAIRINAGEYHFPVLDAENNFYGGPTVTLLNPPASYPADLPGFGLTTGFYDDRVYRTKNGTIVHTGATQADIDNNNPLCGVGAPTITFSNQITGFDTSTNQRAFGQSGNLGNANTVCNGSFGDTKGLDQWTFFPSVAANNFLNIVSPDLTISKTHTPTDFVKGGTGTYVITVPNSGGDATNGTQVTVTDTLPTGIIPTAASGTGWNCIISGQTVTCTRSDVLAAGSSYPNISINVSIDADITATTVTNTATVSGGGDGDNTNNTSPPDVANIISSSSTSNLILVKRITRINNQDYDNTINGRSDVSPDDDQYVATPRDIDDDDAKWPNGYLQGLIHTDIVKPGDELEYTIYFLSNGENNAVNVKLCDLVPSNVTFLPAAFNNQTPNDSGLAGADQGIAMAVGSTEPTVYFSNVADSDRGTFYPANDPNTPNFCSSSNTNGAIVVEITRTLILPVLPFATGSGTPPESYGFVRFRAKVK
ncbi:DUF11 domain-containing protein [Nostoc sp. UHCC 0870]|uniref:DUF11 domain-containing protein n=1 Tax=Nostoc sp. UHCC 0870 TaxID=2914041 RepID=UPI001EDE79C3|nr:DUF11 domain-containing protein [Nostoc sp. UHCC 0870]UKO97279.1 DUF11 domain-containing protein [Nostoc sp. UHCC 0870]